MRKKKNFNLTIILIMVTLINIVSLLFFHSYKNKCWPIDKILLSQIKEELQVKESQVEIELAQERKLLTQKSPSTQAYSLLYGFKIQAFHPDWECNNQDLNFTEDGLEIICKQKPCQADENVEQKWPAPRIHQSPACNEELNQRQYPYSSLATFKMMVQKETFSVNEDFESVGFDPKHSTPKGIRYGLEHQDLDPRQAGYDEKYQVIFYSPNQLNDPMIPDPSGQKIYAKFILNFDLQNWEPISEEKIIELTNRLIDAIEFKTY